MTVPLVERPLVVLGCGKTKRPEPAPAIDLYTGLYTRTQVEWARSVTTEDRIVIFSAKHGLIRSQTVIEPYDVTWRHSETADGADAAVTDQVLRVQARSLGLDGVTLVLAGAAYRRRLLRATRGRVVPVHPFVEHLRAEGRHGGVGTLMWLTRNSHGTVPEHPDGDTRLVWNSEQSAVHQR